MKKRNLLWGIAASLLFGMATTACSEDDPLESGGGNNGNGGNTSGSGSRYIVAGTSSEATYLLATDRLDEGEASIVGNGMEVDNATTWLFYKNKYAYRLVYNQGNAGVTTSYQLDADGTLEERNIRHEIQNRFTTYGIFENYILTAASGATDRKDAAGNPQYGITFTLIDAEGQTLSTRTVGSENLIGTGEYCTVSGFVESNGKIYTAVCPEGVSVYGVQNNGNLLSEEAKKLINEEGGISGAIAPDKVWVAIYNGTDFENPTLISDDRISYATSRYRSQYYQTIDADDAGNIYVFSSSYATTQEGIQKTSLPSGVVRIQAGADTFDPDYYVNLEEASVAGRAMYKVWHVTGDYFLLQMYAEPTDNKSYKANTNRFGIFKAGEGKFTWVEGLPDAETIGSVSKNAYVENGAAYLAVVPTTEGAKPTLYQIDPQTAVAKAGLIVTADGIGAIGKLTY